MDSIEVTVPSLEWYEDEPLTLSFPAEWEVKRCRMACEGHPGMSEDEIRAAISKPVGSPTLEALAGNAEEVVIIIDDMTRPTKSYQYAVPILETLHGAGIPRDKVRVYPGTMSVSSSLRGPTVHLGASTS